MEPKMKNHLIYDLPTRIFHWLFAGLFVTAFFIAKTIDDDSPTFYYHMLAGLLLGFTVLLRILWGIVGTKYSRFSSFALHPKDLLAYLMGILTGDRRKWPGHNPASSWAALAMFVLALGLGITGYLMASGQTEEFEDFHELLANGFLVVVLMHVAGVVLHSLRHQDAIGLSMVHGKKKDIADSDGIASARPGVAFLFVGLVLMFTSQLVSGFDSKTLSLSLFGRTLQLGEGEESNSEEHGDTKAEGQTRNDEDGEDDD
jgi:cytochrome b